MSEASDVPVIEMRGGLLGFPDMTRFALIKMNDEGLVYRLQSLESEAVNFVVVPAMPFFPNYSPVVDDDVADRFNLAAGADVLVLLIVTLGESFKQSTVNLMAPVLLDPARQVAEQVIIENAGLSVRAPLMAA
ncbi:flagellar assembly protein FliW [bacterium]|jgi:flagellar assembly factor FliW|nr:flagellar assembly protein FliW [bacterium]